MIKIENMGDCINATISGSDKEIYNDCRSLIRSVYMNADFGEIFLEAWDSVQEERKEKND